MNWTLKEKLAAAVLVLASAGTAGARTVSVDAFVANPGMTVEVPVAFGDTAGLSCASVNLTYDAQILEFAGAKAGTLGSLFNDDFTVNADKAGTVSIGAYAESNLVSSVTGSLARLVFRVRAGTAGQFSDLTIADVRLGESSSVKDTTFGNPVVTQNGMIRVFATDAEVVRLERAQYLLPGATVGSLALTSGDGVMPSPAASNAVPTVTGALTADGAVAVAVPASGWTSGTWNLLLTTATGLSFSPLGLPSGASFSVSTSNVSGGRLYRVTVRLAGDSGAATTAYTIRFNRNDGSGATVSRSFERGVAAALPWPGSVLGWTRTGHSMVGWAIAPASTVATYANGETVTDIAAAGKTINLYAIWKPTASYSYKVQFHAMDGTGRTYDQTFAKDEAKCLAWLDSVLKWSRSGYIFCGWSTVGSSRVCNYNNGSKVSNLTLTLNGTVHLYAVWLSGTSHRIIFHRNLSATDTLTRQEVFWAGTEQTLAYLESQLGWNRKGYTFAGWAKTRDATAAQYANGQKVKDLAGKGKTLNLYALWRNNATGQIATSSANALSSAGAFGCARAGAAAGSSAASAGTVPQSFETTVFDLSGQAYRAAVVLHANGFAEAVVTTAGGEAYATGEGSVADGELKLELDLNGEVFIR